MPTRKCHNCKWGKLHALPQDYECRLDWNQYTNGMVCKYDLHRVSNFYEARP